MKIYFLITLFTILAPTIIFGQTTKKDIIGNWIKFKAERIDGSKIIDRIGMDTAFLEYSFTEKDFSSQFHPFEKKDGFDYYIKNNRIYVDIFNEYLIEKITSDTLILSVVSQKEPAHKTNRYYFIKKNTLSKRYPIKSIRNIPVYNKYNTPRVHKTFTKYLKTCNSGNHKAIKFKGFLTFDHGRKNITAYLNFLSNTENTRKSTIKSCIEKTYLYWDFAEVNKYPKSKIYFVAQSTGNSEYIRFVFCTDDFSEIDKFKSINFDEFDKSKEYFLKGISNVENNLLDSAIKNFTLSYKFDDVRIEAIYERAEVFLLKGDNEKACEDWNFLMNLDQELARSKHSLNCN